MKNNWEWEDVELATPEHDEMVLELLDSDNLKKLIPCLADLETSEIRTYSEKPIYYRPLEGRNLNEEHCGKIIIGYWDVVVRAEGMWNGVCIEVKPKIFSFGATLRQIKRYCSYDNISLETHYLDGRVENNVYIYTRDHRFDKAFASQGIKVIDGGR